MDLKRDEEEKRRRRNRNLALLAVLLLFVGIIYGITIVKFSVAP